MEKNCGRNILCYSNSWSCLKGNKQNTLLSSRQDATDDRDAVDCRKKVKDKTAFHFLLNHLEFQNEF